MTGSTQKRKTLARHSRGDRSALARVALWVVWCAAAVQISVFISLWAQLRTDFEASRCQGTHVAGSRAAHNIVESAGFESAASGLCDAHRAERG